MGYYFGSKRNGNFHFLNLKLYGGLMRILFILFLISCKCEAQINISNAAGLACSSTNATAVGYSDRVYTAGKLYLFVLMTTGATNPGTISGTTLTWSEVITTGNSTRRIQIYRAMPTVTTASTEDLLANNFGGAITGYAAALYEITGIPTTGTNGSDAIVQAVSGGATGADPSITMAAISNNRSAVISAFFNDANPFNGTPESGWEEAGDCGYDTPDAGGYVMTRLLTTDNTPTVTASSSTWIGVAIELASAGRRIFTIQ